VAWTVNAGFESFYAAINLSGDHRSTANSRRDDVIKTLAKKLHIVDSYNSGSIHRYTAVTGYADLDVMVALHFGKHVEGNSPAEVLQLVRDALGEYRNNVRKNGQAVTLHYKTWPNVDIVPASRVVDNYGNVVEYKIPDMNTGLWITTNPKNHTNDITSRSSATGVYFRRIITMIKWWNKKHSDYLQSYHIEVMALRIFETEITDYSWSVFQFFDKAADLAASPLWHDKGIVDNYLNYNSREEVVKRLRTASNLARDAWYLTYDDKNDHAGAVAKWRQLFGDKFPSYG